MMGLIILVAIVFFLFNRLNQVMGVEPPHIVKNGENSNSSIDEGKVINGYAEEVDIKDNQTQTDEQLPEFSFLEGRVISLPNKGVLEQRSFLIGAFKAFLMIDNAFNEGDITLLKKLLAEDVFSSFQQKITDRIKADRTVKSLLSVIDKVELVDVKVFEDAIVVYAKFIGAQTKILLDNNGSIVQGDPDYVQPINQTWQFQQKKDSSSSAWTVISITNN